MNYVKSLCLHLLWVAVLMGGTIGGEWYIMRRVYTSPNDPGCALAVGVWVGSFALVWLILSIWRPKR